MTPSADRLSIRLLPSAVSGDASLQYSSSYLIGDDVAVDAGSVGLFGGPQAQQRVRHVLLTHSHADHIASLPMLLENSLTRGAPPLEVWAGAATLACLRADVFNDRVWPSLERVEREFGPVLVAHELESEREVRIGSLRVLPVEVDHTVPTLGFIVSRGGASVVLSGDTGPTERLWRRAAQTPDLRAVYLECAFPDELEELARLSMHLTPRTFALERAKLEREADFIAVHLKPRFRAPIVEQLRALGIAGLRIGEPHEEHRW